MEEEEEARDFDGGRKESLSGLIVVWLRLQNWRPRLAMEMETQIFEVILEREREREGVGDE